MVLFWTSEAIVLLQEELRSGNWAKAEAAMAARVKMRREVNIEKRRVM